MTLNELEQRAKELWIAEHRHDAGRVTAIKAGLLTADDRRALRAIVAAHEISGDFYDYRSALARAVAICDQEAAEWDSDSVVTNKNYAAACASRIRELAKEEK